jgi:uncharacterized protein YggE
MKQNNNNGPIYAGAVVICVLIVTLGVVFSGVLNGGAGPQGSTLSTVAVSASGSVKGVPSMATVDLFINATGNSTNAATANFSTRLAAFNKTVYSYIGGNTSLVKTQYYSVGKVSCPYNYYGGGAIMPVTPGCSGSNSTNSVAPLYQAQESITVTLPQIANLNNFLSNITQVQGLEVQGVSAILSDSQVAQLRQQALQSAIANATSQARQIIGNATIVNTNVTVGSYYAYPYPLYASANGGAALAKGQLYYNGTSSVYESIQATFYYRK